MKNGDWVIHEKSNEVFKILKIWKWKDSFILLRDDCIDSGDVESIDECRLATKAEISSEIVRRRK